MAETQLRARAPQGSPSTGFMRRGGIYSTSGGEYTQLRNQMNRLFRCQVELIYEDENGECSVASRIVDRAESWWNPKRPDERSLWESKIEPGEKFFNEIIRHPVPLDMNALQPAYERRGNQHTGCTGERGSGLGRTDLDQQPWAGAGHQRLTRLGR